MIGWGMIAEGYANFGVAGIAAVAALVGAFLGLITRITVAAPFMSLQNFLGILIMVISVQTELVMVVLVTATLQSVASLLLLAGVHAQPLIAIERSGLLERIGEDNALPDVRTALDRARAIVATSR